ncbi:cell motility mediator [Hyaloraphidium curvatum]|nr:cell motility mediator [Hyaloraphidium curvatum]
MATTRPVVRRASHAGSWYTRSGTKLRQELQGWLDQVPKEVPDKDGGLLSLPSSRVRAVIAPHAGYSYSGPTAAWAYRAIDPTSISRVFVLGPSHHFYLDGCAVSACTELETPLGNLQVDRQVTDELMKTGEFSVMSISVDEDEHSIEMHLPYVHKIMQGKNGPYTVVPILVGAISTAKEAHYGELLSPYLADPANLFVISSDFCHWGSRFSYTARHHSSSTSTPIHKSIELLDRDGMDLIEQGDVQGFADYLKKTRNTICGRHPIGVLLNALRALDEERHGSEQAGPAGTGDMRTTFVRYAQSSQVLDTRDSSVSYASALTYRTVQ